MTTATITDWHGCYDEGWKGMIVPEAFAHPAKFSYSLICRIIRHGLGQGYWRKGDLIGDCFGGVATGGIVCGYHGLNWVGCELEPRFVELGNKNLEMHAPRWLALESACIVKLLQGDSRRFAEVVGQVAGVVSSPPYADSMTRDGEDKDKPGLAESVRSRMGKGCVAGRKYGESPGQIGSLKSGSLDGVVTSPPFMSTHAGHDDNDRWKAIGGVGGANSKYSDEHPKDSTLGGDGTSEQAKIARKIRAESIKNIGCIVQSGNKELVNVETYWQAMHAVYSSMREAMKPGGVAAIVVKDYVSKKARVPLCDQTCTLLESLGFEIFERCRCWLVKETREPSLFGGEHVTTTERKSFFRRLAEKNGSPRIDWEEAIWCRSRG